MGKNSTKNSAAAPDKRAGSGSAPTRGTREQVLIVGRKSARAMAVTLNCSAVARRAGTCNQTVSKWVAGTPVRPHQNKVIDESVLVIAQEMRHKLTTLLAAVEHETPQEIHDTY